MSKKDKFFNKVKLGEKESKITAAAISEKHLITGEVNGTVTCYEILNKKVNPVKEQSGKNKIDKILIPPNRKIAFILTGGEVILGNIPSFSNYKQLIKKDVADMYINTDDPQILTIFLKQLLLLCVLWVLQVSLPGKKWRTETVTQLIETESSTLFTI